MDKVYVVKSVNVDEDSFIIHDDNGVGVFLNYEDAKICYDLNVKDIKELYEDYDPDTIVSYEDKENEGRYFFYIHCNETDFSDLVGLYECTIGQWGNTDVKEWSEYKQMKQTNK